jgi:8-oxo-dGTP diphosphatase
MIDRPSLALVPTFGTPDPGTLYVERPSAYGICPGSDGRIAIAEIGSRAPFEYDLPGGGVDPGEDELEALTREFLEETGLIVVPGRLITRANQLWQNKDQPRNSACVYYECKLDSRDGTIVEPDHRLVWLSPDDALRRLRHDAHAWAVAKWLRQARNGRG